MAKTPKAGKLSNFGGKQAPRFGAATPPKPAPKPAAKKGK